MLSESTMIRVNRQCTWKELGGNIIILQSHTSPPITHELNTTGSFIWIQLQKGMIKYSELLKIFLSEFEVDPKRGGEDLEALLLLFRDKGLLCTED